MKRFSKKIGKKTEKLSEDEVARIKVRKVIAVLLILSLAACEKAWHGADGKPGDAYLSLNWQVEEPEYIDAGSIAIPPVFYWGEYYKIRPGNYYLYYEGSVWSGMAWASYAWEVSYEIWEIPGERGDWYYQGADGPDNYFTVICSPYGPNISNGYKSGEPEHKYEIISEKENEIKVKQSAGNYELRIKYKKVEAKKKREVETLTNMNY